MTVNTQALHVNFTEIISPFSVPMGHQISSFKLYISEFILHFGKVVNTKKDFTQRLYIVLAFSRCNSKQSAVILQDIVGSSGLWLMMILAPQNVSNSRVKMWCTFCWLHSYFWLLYLSTCPCVCVCIYIYIHYHPQTVSLYHNSSLRLDTQDDSSWDWNPPNFILD